MQAKYWQQYAELELDESETSRAKQVFSRCLLACPNVKLWSVYLRFIKKVQPCQHRSLLPLHKHVCTKVTAKLYPFQLFTTTFLKSLLHLLKFPSRIFPAVQVWCLAEQSRGLFSVQRDDGFETAFRCG